MFLESLAFLLTNLIFFPDHPTYKTQKYYKVISKSLSALLTIDRAIKDGLE